MTEPTERVRELLRHTADHIPGGPVTVPGPDVLTGVAPARRGRGLLLVAVFGIVVLAVAVPMLVLGGRESQTPSATGAPPPSAPPPSAPAAVDCGTFVLGQGEDLPDSAIGCFEQALQSGRPARLQVTLPTVEGDPIVHSYRSDRDGRVEVVIDATRDKFGSQQVVRQTCTGPTPGTIFTFAQCSELTPTTP